MFQSATIKLTLYYLGIICIICIAFSAAIYHFAGNELYRGLDTQSQRITNEFPGFNFNPALHPLRDYNAGSHRILWRLIYFNLLVLVAAGFASYALARHTLRPIQASHAQQKRFTADVSHELRTPLTALKMSSEVALLDTAASKAELRQALRSNLDEADKLGALINNLFRLTRLEADELRQQFTAVRLDTLGQSALDDNRALAAAKHIALQAEVAPTLVQGDGGSLAQLMTILLDNAIKYSPAKSTVELSVDHTKNTARLVVRDHGIGIEPAALHHVFDRFYRADAARVRSETSGFGLGLSIAKLIADVHHGRLTIASRVGGGTTVTLSLPRADTPAHPDE